MATDIDTLKHKGNRGAAIPVIAGAPTDVLYRAATAAPVVNGAIALDSVGSRLYVRVGGAWVSTVLA